MSRGELETMLASYNIKSYNIKGVMVDPEKLIFEERVKMNCFYCGKYNNNWKCPPKLPDIDYKKLLSEFQNAAFIYLISSIDEDNFSMVRKDSSTQLHKAMLECEKWLWENNNSTALSFIGGSCKLCKNGCAEERCANPYMARTPVEAIGINVVESAKRYGVEIQFPPKNELIRIGLLLW